MSIDWSVDDVNTDKVSIAMTMAGVDPKQAACVLDLLEHPESEHPQLLQFHGVRQ